MGKLSAADRISLLPFAAGVLLLPLFLAARGSCPPEVFAEGRMPPLFVLSFLAAWAGQWLAPIGGGIVIAALMRNARKRAELFTPLLLLAPLASPVADALSGLLPILLPFVRPVSAVFLVRRICSRSPSRLLFWFSWGYVAMLWGFDFHCRWLFRGMIRMPVVAGDAPSVWSAAGLLAFLLLQGIWCALLFRSAPSRRVPWPPMAVRAARVGLPAVLLCAAAWYAMVEFRWRGIRQRYPYELSFETISWRHRPSSPEVLGEFVGLARESEALSKRGPCRITPDEAEDFAREPDRAAWRESVRMWADRLAIFFRKAGELRFRRDSRAAMTEPREPGQMLHMARLAVEAAMLQPDPDRFRETAGLLARMRDTALGDPAPAAVVAGAQLEVVRMRFYESRLSSGLRDALAGEELEALQREARAFPGRLAEANRHSLTFAAPAELTEPPAGGGRGRIPYVDISGVWERLLPVWKRHCCEVLRELMHRQGHDVLDGYGVNALRVWRPAAGGEIEYRLFDLLLAAERFRRTNGFLPRHYGDLVPTYLPGIPVDLTHGKAVRIRTWEGGFEAASAGDPPESFRLGLPEADQ